MTSFTPFAFSKYGQRAPTALDTAGTPVAPLVMPTHRDRRV